MRVSLGTMNFDMASVSEPFSSCKIKEILETASKLGITHIDTAYYYGKSEKYLGETGLLHGFKVTSKANPWYNNDFTNGFFGQLSPEPLSRQLHSSLRNTGLSSFDTYFLHCWDYSTDIRATLTAFDEHYRKERFTHFGVSNISPVQLQEVIGVSESLGLVSPSVYQGMYNVYCRKVTEIFSVLDDYGMTFECYNPLAGGLLAGNKLKNKSPSPSRFSNNPVYTSIFKYDSVVPFTHELNADMSLKWLRDTGVDVVIGCSTIDHLLSNYRSLTSTEPLTSIQIGCLSRFYENCKKFAPNYYY